MNSEIINYLLKLNKEPHKLTSEFITDNRFIQDGYVSKKYIDNDSNLKHSIITNDKRKNINVPNILSDNIDFSLLKLKNIKEENNLLFPTEENDSKNKIDLWDRIEFLSKSNKERTMRLCKIHKKKCFERKFENISQSSRNNKYS
jgi:hypothetical protein